MISARQDAALLRQIKAAGAAGGLILVRYDRGEFWAIFDNAYQSVIDGMVESLGPALTARTSDVTALPKEVVLDVDGADYRIKRPEQDGMGMTVLMLKI